MAEYGYNITAGRVVEYEVYPGTDRAKFDGPQKIIATFTTTDKGVNQYNFKITPNERQLKSLGVSATSVIQIGGQFKSVSSDFTTFDNATGWDDTGDGGGSNPVIGAQPGRGNELIYYTDPMTGNIFLQEKQLSTNKIVKNEQIGTNGEDGMHLTRELSTDEMNGFGLTNTSDIFIGDTKVTWDGQIYHYGTDPAAGPTASRSPYEGIAGFRSDLVKPTRGYEIPVSSGGYSTDKMNELYYRDFMEARKAQDAKFGAAYEGTAQNYQEIMDSLEGAGKQQKIELRQNYSNAGNAAQNDLIQRGVSGSTVKPAVQMGYQRQQNNAMNTLNENLTRERIGYKNDAFKQIIGVLGARSDPYPSLPNHLSSIQGTA